MQKKHTKKNADFTLKTQNPDQMRKPIISGRKNEEPEKNK